MTPPPPPHRPVLPPPPAVTPPPVGSQPPSTGSREAVIPPWRQHNPPSTSTEMPHMVLQARQGVYQKARPVVVLSDEKLGLPRFFSARFFHFLGDFLLHPTNNPMFNRELRRVLRRFSWMGGWLWVVMPFFATLLALAVVVPAVEIHDRAVRSGNEDEFVAWYYGVFLFIHVICNFLAFFSALNATQNSFNRAMLDELAVTPLRTEAIAWGSLVGSIWPIAVGAALLMPAMVSASIGVAMSAGINNDLAPMSILSLALVFVPHLFATMFLTGAIALHFSWTAQTFGQALFRSLAMCLLAGAILGGPMIVVGGSAMPWSFIVAVPVALVLKLGAGCGFLHAMIRHIAESQLVEARGGAFVK